MASKKSAKSAAIVNPIMKYPVPLSTCQQAVFNANKAGKSVSVKACAGSGKSHTARACAINSTIEVNSIPFMVALAEAEKDFYKSYGHITVGNFHSRGLRLLSQNSNNIKIKVDKYKVNELVKKMDVESKYHDVVCQLATNFKNEGVGTYDKALSYSQIAFKYGIDEKHIDSAIALLALSDGDKYCVDGADMIRFPVLFGLSSFLNGYSIEDEVQDYTPASFAFVTKCLVKKGSQVLMIGDPERQALMQFVGASVAIFDEMSEYYGCVPLTLNENRRCSKAVVAACPHKGDMVALPDAPEGEVGSYSYSQLLDEVEQGMHKQNAILAMANAPLIQLGIAFLLKGIPCQMRTEKLEGKITNACYAAKALWWNTPKKDWFCPIGTMAETLRSVHAERLAKTQEEGKPDGLIDIINCIEALESYCLAKQIFKTPWTKNEYGKSVMLHPVIFALRQMMNSEKGITLRTGHTAKGLEWHTVFILSSKMRKPEQDWQQNQLDCLDHVMRSRPRMNLYDVVDNGSQSESDDCQEDNEEWEQ